MRRPVAQEGMAPTRRCHVSSTPGPMYNEVQPDGSWRLLPEAVIGREAMAEGELIGKVTHVFDRIDVAVVSLSRTLSVGDTVHFLGRHTDFQQQITSMQVEHQPVTRGEAGSEVAIKAKQRVHSGDSLFRISGES
jgi:hypothetical protein